MHFIDISSPPPYLNFDNLINKYSDMLYEHSQMLPRPIVRRSNIQHSDASDGPKLCTHQMNTRCTVSLVSGGTKINAPKND